MARRRAYTRQEIHDMSDEDLVTHFNAKESLAIKAMAKMSLSSDPPAKRPDESAADFAKRYRTDREETYPAELAIRLRAEAEKFLWNQQKPARAADLFENTPLSDEEKEKLARAQANIKAREAQEKLSDLEGGIRLIPDGVGPLAMEVDDKKGKKK